MDYRGLTADDLANINALNHSFLTAISESRMAAFSTVAGRQMTLTERTWLASAPFLLFSFREGDQAYWQRLLDKNPQIDLIDSSDRPNRRIRQVQAAGLSFLWQLARHNPYVVRLVCGAPLGWCEQLSSLTLIELLQQAAQRSDLLRLRFAGDDKVWGRLLDYGTVANRSGRRASHYSALQVMLTRRPRQDSTTLSAAACSLRTPGQQLTRRHAEGLREPEV